MRSNITLWATILVCVPMGIVADASVDWLIQAPPQDSTIVASSDSIVMQNGLIARTFSLVPAFGTVDLTLNASFRYGGLRSMFRAVKPEGEVVLDGMKYALGGLEQTQGFRAYRNASDFSLAHNSLAFQYYTHEVSEPVAPFPWVPGTRHSPQEYHWPPKGKRLNVTLRLPETELHRKFQVNLIYEIYDGIPLISKYLEISKVPQADSRNLMVSEYGWTVVSGNMTDSAAEGLCLCATQPQTYAYGNESSMVVSAIVTESSAGKSGEPQSNIGLSSNSSADRNSWDFLLSFDDGGAYMSHGHMTPVLIASGLGSGTMLRIVYNESSRSAKFYVNQDVHGILNRSSTSTLPLIPQIQYPSANSPKLCHITPSSAVRDTAVVNSVTPELLGLLPEWGAYLTHGSLAPGADSDGPAATMSPNPLYMAKTDQAHGAECQWLDDFPNSVDNIPNCPSCKDEGAVEPYLNCSYTATPGVLVDETTTFVSFKTFGLAMDSMDITRQTLSRHRVTQLLAPHTTENPVFFHGTDADLGFQTAINQMAEVGFEMFIFSFGTSFHLESKDPAYLASVKKKIDYAKSKGIEVGGYDLICLDRGGSVPKEYQAGGNEGDACFASGWVDQLNGLVLEFINKTGLSMLETDGPYGGETCSSTTHAHHHGLADSVYWQTRLQSEFYQQMRHLGLYINQPDTYFFQGGNRDGMGYDEQQYSLPRWRDLTISRMGMYDDLYGHLPTQGWMFLPISDYHAGGPDAEFANHAEAYEWALAQYLGAGTAACYRGPKPYNTPEMQGILSDWIGWYKAHRYTLTQPIQHIRRPSMSSWDGWVHINPFALGASQQEKAGHQLKGAGPEVGVAVFFNPMDTPIDARIPLPVYYCGLKSQAVITIGTGTPTTLPVDEGIVALSITMPPRSIHRVLINRPA